MLDSELSILAIYGIFVALGIVAQTSGTLGQLGIGYILSARNESRSASGIAARLERAQNNSVVAMTLFAPAILILALNDRFSDTTLLAAQIFLLARIIYLPAYAFGITGLRTLAWLSGFLAILTLYFLAL